MDTPFGLHVLAVQKGRLLDTVIEGGEWSRLSDKVMGLVVLSALVGKVRFAYIEAVFALLGTLVSTS